MFSVCILFHVEGEFLEMLACLLENACFSQVVCSRPWDTVNEFYLVAELCKVKKKTNGEAHWFFLIESLTKVFPGNYWKSGITTLVDFMLLCLIPDEFSIWFSFLSGAGESGKSTIVKQMK